MSNEIKKGLSFAKEVLARIKGEPDQVIAQQNARKGVSALEGQLAALNAVQVDLEVTVEDGKEALANAIYPTTKITDNKMYVRNIENAQKALDKAEEELADVNSSIEYWSKMLAKF